MEIRALRMTLSPGQIDEYRRRHDALWPELAAALTEAGIEDYRIFVDAETRCLFALMHLRDDHRVDALAEREVMQRWWRHMADIMATNDDQSPRTALLEEVFHFTPGAGQ
ncbi:L-rhamnose mutarotase [Halomonas sp. V046]|uniref:L-rhamnose mutarotase n=1 Tax=Halomonas sp. V046 TaxID=3459611 RepID=UPI004044773D